MAPRHRKINGSSDESSAIGSNAVPKPSKQKKNQDSKSGTTLLRRCCGTLKYLLLLVIVPPFLNYASLQKEKTELKPDGELYDIGWGQNLFMKCHGVGPPTVLLDSPTGMTSDVWSKVWPEVSKHAKVCVYDRAGLGFSDRPSLNSSKTNETNSREWQPFTVERMAADLHRLITSSSQQPKPFIIVGAELGATVAQFYTQMYESDIVGLILINPLTETLFEQDQGVWSQYWFGQLIPTYQTLQLGAALGLTRLALLLGVLKHPLVNTNIDTDIEYRQKHLLCHPRHLSTVVDEHHFINDSFSQIKTVRLLKSISSEISVSIVTGNYYDEQMPSSLNKAWAKTEQQLISKHFPNAQHLVVNGADHHMIYKQPEDVSQVIIKMIKQYKSHVKSSQNKKY
ncbi:hypothetical protein LOTGIDRAFT_228523 [Lottia gigantea]|uniref:acylglycerol lipase n=1 Tax=Lottia gigantea TaxID=225164 RepID=V4AAE8_LOTGI|nr:hypothetical protein LOTGIDRAFT_228523 [Lottia gigantea]ESO93742.1 hypothetical protein LOTGIDRAFT_228523 [Lottia gigantea]